MKRIWVYFIGILLVVGLELSPFHSTDVGKLLPVELVRISGCAEAIRLETDTGNAGIGADIMAALEDLKSTASGMVFLDTADYLLLEPGCEDALPELQQYLRPSCAVCLEMGDVDLKEAAKFLRTHTPEMNLLDWRMGERDFRILLTQEERMKLV